MREDAMHARCMGMLLGWCARNMHLCITFMCGVSRLGNFVWEASDTRSFSHAHAIGEVHQYDTTQVDNSSNSVNVKLHVMPLVHM
jgi:hypothetical protein